MSTDKQRLDQSLEGVPPEVAERVRAFRLLLVGGARLRRLLERELAPSGITVQQGSMLSWIEAQAEPPTLKLVAEGLGMTHQNVKQIALALERKGFLEIAADPADRRARRLVLTEQHRRFWRERNVDDFAAVQSWLSVLSDAEVKQLVRLMRRLHEHLGAVGGAG